MSTGAMRVSSSSMATSVSADCWRRSYIRGAPTHRRTLRRQSKLLAAGVNPEGVAQAAASSGGDDHGVAGPGPLDPAQIEAAPGDRGAERAGDVRAPLGPVEAKPAELTAR